MSGRKQLNWPLRLCAAALTAWVMIPILCTPIHAEAEGSWPPEARGEVLPKPSWVLVIPVVRSADGSIEAWNRKSTWTRRWVVPKTTGEGLRTVAITGDSEDARMVTGEAIDNMDTASLGRISAKYGAPAIAVVVQSALGDTAVAAWSPGMSAVWDMTEPGEDSHAGALRIIGQLFSGRATPRLRIAGVRTMDGAEQYKLESDDPATLDRLYDRDGLTVVEESRMPGHSYAVVTVSEGRDIESVLEGLIVSRR